MTWDIPGAVPTDADLVAYLDGELSPTDSVRIGQRIATDPALAARASLLMKGGRPFQEAFAPLLAQAPTDRLDAMLTEVVDRSPAAPGRQSGFWSSRSRAPAIAAALALLVTGAALDRWIATPLGTTIRHAVDRQEDDAEWRRAVAQYLSLYRRDTLAGAEALGPAQSGALANLGHAVGLHLTPARLDLPSLPMKRADLYDYDGKPIAFLAYLDPSSGPVALCITPGTGDDAQRTERRRGMNVVYWSTGQNRFMLIGHAPLSDLQAAAGTIEARMADAAEDRG